MSIAGNTLDLIRSVFRRDNTNAGSVSLVRNQNGYSAYNFGPDAMGLGPASSEMSQQVSESVRLDQDLMSRYSDYESMDEYPELGSALDLYADDATQIDVTTGKSIWVEAEDATIERVLTETFEKNLRVEEDIWEIARNLCKYGNNFEEIVVLDGMGVSNLVNIPTPATRRIEDAAGILHGFIYDPSMSFNVGTKEFFELLRQREASISEMRNNTKMSAFEPWELVHFRLRGKNRNDLYGSSILEPARWVWKRLSMLEDAMLMYKLTRSPQRFMFLS